MTTREFAYKKIDEIMVSKGFVPYETRELEKMPDGTTPIIAGHPDLSWSEGQETVSIAYQ